MLLVIKLLEIGGVRTSFILSTAQHSSVSQALPSSLLPSSAAPRSFLISVSALSSIQEPEAKPTALC